MITTTTICDGCGNEIKLRPPPLVMWDRIKLGIYLVHDQTLEFCSYACLSEWARKKKEEGD